MTSSASFSFAFASHAAEEGVTEETTTCSSNKSMLHQALSKLKFSVDVEMGEDFEIKIKSINFTPKNAAAGPEMQDLKAATVKLMECLAALQKASKPESFCKEISSEETVAQADYSILPSETSFNFSMEPLAGSSVENSLDITIAATDSTVEPNDLEPAAAALQTAVQRACKKMVPVISGGDKRAASPARPCHCTRNKDRVKNMEKILKNAADPLNIALYYELDRAEETKQAENLEERPNFYLFDTLQLKENLTRYPKSKTSLALNTIPKSFPNRPY